MSDPTLEVAKALIGRSSVTPEDGGCCDLFAERLRSPEAVEALSVFLRRSGAAH